VASPSRTTPLGDAERHALHKDLDRWYFDDGNGIFMPRLTRNMFVTVQHNLSCPVESIRPEAPTASAAVDPERRRGCICIRQLSLLRTQLKIDLSLHFGFSHLSHIHPGDREFLRTCGISPWRRPWRKQLFRASVRMAPSSCVCGTCHDHLNVA
jgi:hypothetical protein